MYFGLRVTSKQANRACITVIRKCIALCFKFFPAFIKSLRGYIFIAVCLCACLNVCQWTKIPTVRKVKIKGHRSWGVCVLWMLLVEIHSCFHTLYNSSHFFGLLVTSQLASNDSRNKNAQFFLIHAGCSQVLCNSCPLVYLLVAKAWLGYKKWDKMYNLLTQTCTNSNQI